jgi:hypothetical protein
MKTDKPRQSWLSFVEQSLSKIKFLIACNFVLPVAFWLLWPQKNWAPNSIPPAFMCRDLLLCVPCCSKCHHPHLNQDSACSPLLYFGASDMLSDWRKNTDSWVLNSDSSKTFFQLFSVSKGFVLRGSNQVTGHIALKTRLKVYRI